VAIHSDRDAARSFQASKGALKAVPSVLNPSVLFEK